MNKHTLDIKTEKLHIYIRVSSDTQLEDGFGLQNQKEYGMKVSEKLGMEPIIHNEGSKSSSSENIEERPILNELMFLINEQSVKNLWVFNNDRLSRNENVWNTIRITLRKNGCRLFVGEGTEYNLVNHMDDFIFGVMSEVTKYDNRVRTDRLRRGKLSKVKKGGWRGGPTPFGYENKDGFLVPNSKEKRWVRKIYESYSKGSSIYEIQKLLMKNGVVSRRGNHIWNDQSVKRILLNTHYEGYHYYRDKNLDETVKCECPKILPSSLIRIVRKRIESLKKTSNHVKTITLLKEFLKCSHCGSKFGQRINSVQYYNHYYCRGNTEKLRTNGLKEEKYCSKKNGRVRSIIINETDNLVWSTVIDVISNSNLFKETFKREVMSANTSYGKSKFERKVLVRNSKKIDEKIGMINDSINSIIVNGVVDKNSDELKPLIKKFEEEKLKLESEKEEILEILSNNKKNTEWYNWINDFGYKIDNLKKEDLNTEDKIKFLNCVLDKVKVTTKDNKTHILEIIFKSPFVNDRLEWNQRGVLKKGYKIIKGEKDIRIEMESFNRRQKKTPTEQRV